MGSIETSCNITAYSEWHSDELEDAGPLPLTLYQLRLDLLQVDRSNAAWITMDFDRKHDEFIKLYGGRRPKRLNITQGQAMEVSSIWCKDELQSLKESSAGGHLSSDYSGDFLLALHDAMCTRYCLASDYLRVGAIDASNCTCMELSTDEDDISYTKEGDFCRKNSGQILCDEIDLSVCNNSCGKSDFMCPRREYNE